MEIQSWCEDYIASMEKTFEKRIRFIGIQGSYGRGEAGAESDIDMVLILDVLTMDDLKAYRKSVAAMELSHLVCGFLCGVKELAAWGKSDLFHLYFDTVPLWGKLDDLVPPPSSEDARDAVSKGLCEIYHGACHNIIFDRDPLILQSLYKGLFFVLRAKYFWEHGQWKHCKSDLTKVVTEREASLLNRTEKRFCVEDLEAETEALLSWVSETMIQINENNS